MGKVHVFEVSSLAGKAVAVVMAVLLATQCYTPAYAQDTDNEVVSDNMTVSSAEDSAASAAVDVSAQSGIDIVDQWESGGVTITQGGEYYLSRDVQASMPLVVAVPENETVTIDLQGHSVEVQGDVAVVLDNASGAVVLQDSTFDERVARGEIESDAEPQCAIRVVCDEAVQSIAALRWNAREETKGTSASLHASHVAFQAAVLGTSAEALDTAKHDAYAVYVGFAYDAGDDAELNALFEACSFSAVVSNEAVAAAETAAWAQAEGRQVTAEHTGVACGIFAQAKGVKLDGATRAEAVSDAGRASLYAGRENAFELQGAFETPDALSVGTSGEGDVVFALWADVEQPDKLASCFTDATSQGRVCVAEDGALALRSKAAEVTEPTGSAASAAEPVAAVEPSVSSEADTAEVQVQPLGRSAVTLDTGIDPAWANVLAGEAVDLNAAWTDTSTTYTISESGTYRLSADLTVTKAAMLLVSGSAIDVVIDLNGHTLTFDLSSGTAGISVVQASSVTITGGSSSAGRIAFSSTVSGSAINMMASSGSLEVRNLSIDMKMDDDAVRLSTLGVHAVNVSKGSLTVDGCTFSIDLSNQTTSELSAATTAPSAVNVSEGSSVQGVVLSNTALSVVGSNVGMLPKISRDEVTGPCVPAYGVYIGTSAPLTMTDCSISVSSPHGSAYGVYAQNATIEGSGEDAGLTVSVGAEYVAAGLFSAKKGGITLDTGLSVQERGSVVAHYFAALYEEVQDGFVLNEGFGGENLGVLVNCDGSGMNQSGLGIATYGFAPTPAQRLTLLLTVTNALGSDAACSIESGLMGLSFVLDEDKAPVEVVHANGTTTPYSTVSQALDAASSGETVRLLKDADATSFSRSGDASTSIMLDLNGFSLGSLSHSSTANLTVYSSTGEGSIEGSTVADGATIVMTGTGSLTLRGIEVRNPMSTSASYGILLKKATGSAASDRTLVLEDTAVLASSSEGEAVGIDIASTVAATVSVQGGYIYAQSTSSGVGSYGIRCPSASSKLSITDCAVSAQGSAGSVIGVSISGTLDARGSDAAGQTFSVAAESSVSTVSAVRATGSAARISLANCAFSTASADDATGQQFWCLASSSTGATAQWTLDGVCDFSSVTGTDVQLRSTPLQLGDQFANGASACISVDSSSLDSTVFAQAANGSSDISAQAQAFTPVEGSAYEGWTSRCSDDNTSQLIWTHSVVARNTATGTEYEGLQEAIDAAAAGETVQLLADCFTYQPLKIVRALTIDLNGYTMHVDAAAQATAGAFQFAAVNAGDVLRMIDTAQQKGSLEIAVGSPRETANESVSISYAGIAVSGGGALQLSGVQTRVMYTGALSGAHEGTLYGVTVSDGSVELLDGAVVEVSACEDGAATGMSYVYGVYATGASTEAGAGANVTIDATSSVKVDSAAPVQQLGHINNGLVNSTTLNTSKLALTQIFPDENSSLYKEILQTFREQAILDGGSTNESASNEQFNMRVYHMAQVSLDDGTLVWAYSNQVPEGQETLDNIVPVAIFVQSLYTVEPQAVGVASASDAACSAVVSGLVEAHAPEGEATALSAQGAGSWTVDGATLQVAGGTQAYSCLSDTRMDLRNYVQADNPPSETWFYPIDIAAFEVEDAQPYSRGIEASDTTSVVLSGALTMDVQGAVAVDVEAPQVSVASTLTAPASPYRMGSASGENAVGTVIVSPEANVTLEPSWFIDAYGVLSPSLAANGALVWDGPYTVEFRTSDTVVATFEDLKAGDSIVLPSAEDMQKSSSFSTSFEFLGWSTNQQASSADIPASKETLVVEGSATYYAVYKEVPLQISLVFKGLRSSDGTLQSSQTVQASYGMTLADASVTPPQQGDYTRDGATYRFVGWADTGGDVHDAQALAESLVFDDDVSGVSSGEVILSARYVRVDEGQYLVTFMNDGCVDAYAVDKDTVPSYYEASGRNAVSPTKIHTVDGQVYTFEGWHTGRYEGEPGADQVTYGADASLPAVVQDTVYTACWSSTMRRAYVRFSYYQKGENGYVRALGDLVELHYGDDPIAEANKAVSPGFSFSQDGLTFTFLGWSVRQDDKEPLYTDSLPAATEDSNRYNGTVYYAIYKQTTQAVNVTFYNGTSVYATADTRPATETVADALTSTGLANPTSSDETLVFRGWATKADATSASVATTTRLYTAASNASELALYAVYTAESAHTVTFVASDETTVLARVEVAAGETVQDTGKVPSAPAVDGSFFKGWNRANGTALDVTQTVSSDERVFATYGAVVTNAVAGDAESGVSGSVDVGKIAVTNSAAQGASQVTFRLQNATEAESALTLQAQAAGDSPVAGGAYLAFLLVDDEKLTTASSLGTASVTVDTGEVAASSQVRVYWMRADGSIASTDALAQDNGTATFEMQDYSALSTRGNILVAEVGTASSSLESSSGLSGASTSGGLTSASSSGALLASDSTGSTLAASASDAALAASEGGDLAGSDAEALLTDDGALAANDLGEGDDTASSWELIAGNPVAWVVAVLILAALASVAWWMLVGRKRTASGDGEDAEGDEGDEGGDGPAGWSDEADKAPAPAKPSVAPNSGTAVPAGGIQF